MILNPQIFDSYGHFNWGSIKTVTFETLDQFTTSHLVKEVHPDGSEVTGKLYAVIPSGDVGTKHHVNVSKSEFADIGGDNDSVYNINYKEASDEFYATGETLGRTHILGQGEVKGFNFCNVTRICPPKPKHHRKWCGTHYCDDPNY